MKVKIEIDTRTFVRFWLVVIGFVLVAWAIYSARTALFIIAAALFLAIAISPVVNRLSKILPSKSRVLSTAISYVAVIAVLGAIIFLAVPPIVDQTAKFAQNVPNLVDGATKQYAGLNDFVNHYKLQPEFTSFIKSIKTGATEFASSLGSILVTGIGSILSIMAAVILILVLTFLMLVEGPIWLERLWSVYNDQDKMENNRNILSRMYGVVTGYVTGQLSIAAIAGAVAGIAVFVLCLIFNITTGLAIPAAAIVFVFALVPMFGETIGAILVSLVLALNSVTVAVIFLAFFVLYQQIDGNYILPKIQSKKIDLSALAIIISVSIGLYLFGPVGGIISIPIAGCIRVLVEEYFVKAKKSRIDSEKPLSKFIKKVQSL